MSQVKLLFQLEVKDDWPPYSVESVWATQIGPRTYRIDNIPWFATQATFEDIVSATETVDGERWFDGIVEPARNSLIRVVLFQADRFQEVMDTLHELGCNSEHDQLHSLLAVNVPPETPLAPVQSYLQAEHAADKLDYEEAILWHPES